MAGNKQLDFLDILSILALAVQIADYDMNIRQTSNDALMKELQKQNKEYLDKILEKQDVIISLLSGMKTE